METNNEHLVIQRPPFKLHLGQAHILKNSAGRRFFTVLCGRRFGKTELIRFILISFIQHGTRIAVFAPKFKDVEETVGYIVELCETINATARANGQAEQYRINKQTKSVYAITFDKQGRELPINESPCVTFNSINTKARAKVGRGGKYDVVIYEETQSIDSDTLRENFESTMRPTLSDYRGIAYFFGTPAFSKKHFFHTLAARGVGNNPMLANADDLKDVEVTTDTDYMTFRLPTDVNPYIDRDELRAAKRSLPAKVYNMEYCAKYVELNNNIWCDALEEKGVSERVFVDTVDIMDYKKHGLKIVISLDFNLQPMAVVIALVCPMRGILHVVRVFGSTERTNITEMCQKVKAWLCNACGVNDLNALPIEITGDATGRGSNVMAKSKGSFFSEVLASLGVASSRLKVKTSNPTHESSYFQTNGYLRKFAGLKISRLNADRLVTDMQQATKSDKNHIDKKEYDPHFLDAYRYILYTYFPERVQYAHALEQFRYKGNVL